MCQDHFSSINCILPPYINSKLADSSDKNLEKVALNNKFRNSRFRSDRAFFSGLSPDQKAIMGLTAKKPAVKASPKMRVYNCKKLTNLSTATLIWSDTSAKLPTDKDAKNVITAGSATWHFYYDLFGRNSVDNMGLILDQYIHYDKKYDNAFWDGRRMIFGDGDRTIFGSFTGDIDIIGHELTHGVTQYSANLAYHTQSGAMNEAFSDIFGIMIKQRALNQDVKTANWLIGENVLLGNEYALRSLKAPGTAYKNHPQLGDDPQPATFDKLVKLPDTADGDWGGVHYNSGIPNFAFYVAAFNMGGFAWEKAGQIWYKTLTDAGSLPATATFSEVRKATLKAATSLYKANSLEVKAVKDGWDAAKVK